MNTLKIAFFSSLLFIFLMSFSSVSAQLKINSSGNIELEGASSTIMTLNNMPITLKVNNVLAGFTGSSANTNVSFGYEALNNPLAGNNNTAIGRRAFYLNIEGTHNAATGYLALQNNTSGCNNTANGSQALFNNTTGWCNTGYGVGALYSNATGWSNTAIGKDADVSSSNISNAIAIGAGAIATASYQVVIGNSSINRANIAVAWTVTSDGRAKKNIKSNVPGLAFIKNLQPVTYNMDLNALDELQKSDDPKMNARRDSLLKARSPQEIEMEAKSRANKEKQVYSGFIAQDVEKAAKSVGYEFSGVDVPEDGKGAYGLRYSEFVVPLVKAVQELSEQNDRLQQQVNELTVLVNKLMGKESSVNIITK